MGTVNPRNRADPSLSGTLKANGDDKRQIRRLLSNVEPTAAVTGTMQGFTRAKATGVTWTTQGPRLTGWTFDTTVDTSGLDKPVLQLDGSGAYFGPTEPGHYETKAQFQCTLGGSPTAVLVQANYNSLTLAEYAENWAHNDFDLRWRVTVPAGKFYCDGTSTPMGLEASVSGAFTAGGILPNTWIDVWRVG